ncbi:MAG: hypothetical protein ABSF69_06395 [Polyangiaceae bacterium]|jgi:hypothetical protein
MRASTGRPRLIALGVGLALREGLVVAAFGLAVVCGLVACAIAFSTRSAGAAHLPMAAALTIAWSAGVMLAFGGGLRAIPRDWDDGVIALVRLRGVSLTSYVWGRVGGLVAVLALAVAGTTFVCGISAIAVSKPVQPALAATAAGTAYALAFSITLGPVAMAALGARSRFAGYMTLLTVLVLPELVSPWTSRMLPAGWQEVTSIPAALDAVRAGVTDPTTGTVHAARAIAGLAAIVAASLAIVRARIPRGEPGIGA